MNIKKQIWEKTECFYINRKLTLSIDFLIP